MSPSPPRHRIGRTSFEHHADRLIVLSGGSWITWFGAALILCAVLFLGLGVLHAWWIGLIAVPMLALGMPMCLRMRPRRAVFDNGSRSVTITRASPIRMEAAVIPYGNIHSIGFTGTSDHDATYLCLVLREGSGRTHVVSDGLFFRDDSAATVAQIANFTGLAIEDRKHS